MHAENSQGNQNAQAILSHLRRQVEALKLQIEILRELGERTGLPVDAADAVQLAAIAEAKLAALESRFTVVH